MDSNTERRLATPMYQFQAKRRRIDHLYDRYAGRQAGDTRDFVSAVNRAYYKHSVDLYAERYIHDIQRHFRHLVATLGLSAMSDLTIVDIGGGTGFEYHQFVQNDVRWKQYCFIEPDQDMLAKFASDHDLAGKNVQLCHGQFQDFSAKLAGIKNKILILNSCLHHVIWIESFLDEVKACMQAGDYLLLCHEPENRYVGSMAMLSNYLLRCTTTDFLPRKLGLLKSTEQAGDRWKKINQDLLCEGLVREPLRPLAIRRIIDYGVGSKGDWRLLDIPRDADEGHWTPDDLQQYLGSSFERKYFRTYRHFGDPGGRRHFALLNSVCASLFNRGGSIFNFAARRCS